jgi:hypothetical protein
VIGNLCFTDCSSLSSLTFDSPSSLQLLSFSIPRSLDSINIPDSVEFLHCPVEVKFPHQLALNFGNNSRLQSLDISISVYALWDTGRVVEQPRAFVRLAESTLKAFRSQFEGESKGPGLDRWRRNYWSSA